MAQGLSSHVCSPKQEAKDPTLGRNCVLRHINEMYDGLRRCFSLADGDKPLFHVTCAATSCATGHPVIPPFLIHSRPGVDDPELGPEEWVGIYEEDDNGKILKNQDGSYKNPTRIGVEVTKNGSMTLELFPLWCQHFVDNLPEGQGKGGKPVILVLDGHASHFSYVGLRCVPCVPCVSQIGRAHVQYTPRPPTPERT